MAKDGLTIVKGQLPSINIREKLAAEGKPVCLAFSCGKDSLATWLALRECGVEVVPAYLYYVPGLVFIEDQLKRYEDYFQVKIHQYPHPLLFHSLHSAAFQAPHRVPLLAAVDMPEISYEAQWGLIVEDLGLKGSWVADGVRAGDSIVRRASFVKNGPMKPSSRKVSPIYDWLKGKVMDVITSSKAPLSDDYRVFGRSYDGLDARFSAPLRRNYPADYERILQWYPLVDVDQIRWERLGEPR